MTARSSFLLTTFEVLCVILTLFGLTQMIDSAGRWQFEIMSNWTSIFVLLGGMLLVSILIATLWHRKDPDRIGKTHHWMQDISAYYLVYMICSYAFAKILKTQFQPPNYVLETPIGELNGFWLTWTYFGFSETFAYILGYTQIAGCVLLLFRKTRLLGAFVLIPVMVNICLIDHFYDISPLAYYNALHYTFMLFLFITLDAKRLLDIFFGYKGPGSPPWRTVGVNVLRITIIALAFYKIYSLRDSFEPKTKLNGVWKINKINRAGQELSQADAIFTKVYIEWRYGCLFKSNPDLFSDKDRHAEYEVDETSSKLKFNLYPNEQHKSPDSLLLDYRFQSDSVLTLTGFYNRDSVRMELARVK
jgi:hypothetical protein